MTGNHPHKRCETCKGPVSYGYPTPKYCRKCYNKNRYLSPKEKFWKYVKKSDGCWLWTGAVKSGGYGLFGVKGRCYTASRFSYILHHGKITKGRIVCHNCPDGDNPLCVNPEHLYAGTYSDNNSDSVKKGRAAIGENKPNATLTNEQVRDLKRNFVRKYGANVFWAKKLGVKIPVIDAIVTGRNYRHIH